MSSTVYEEVALHDMTYVEDEQMYYYECPCGDMFEISLEDLYDGEDTAPCPSCTLQIRVLFDEVRCYSYGKLIQIHAGIVPCTLSPRRSFLTVDKKSRGVCRYARIQVTFLVCEIQERFTLLLRG